MHSSKSASDNRADRSLLNRDLEEELVPTCRELGIGIVAYSPLCRSLLAGQVTTVEQLSVRALPRPSAPAFEAYSSAEAAAVCVQGGAADKRPERYPRFLPENIAANAAV